jgi:hypothetical protein
VRDQLCSPARPNASRYGALRNSTRGNSGLSTHVSSCFLRMTERTTQLEAALSAQSALIEEAQAEIINHLSGQIGSPEFIDRIIHLFDGPQQREALRLAREALGEDFGNNA